MQIAYRRRPVCECSLQNETECDIIFQKKTAGGMFIVRPGRSMTSCCLLSSAWLTMLPLILLYREVRIKVIIRDHQASILNYLRDHGGAEECQRPRTSAAAGVRPLKQ